MITKTREFGILSDIDNRLRWAFECAKTLLTEQLHREPSTVEVRDYLAVRIGFVQSRPEQPAKNGARHGEPFDGESLRGESYAKMPDWKEDLPVNPGIQ